MSENAANAEKPLSVYRLMPRMTEVRNLQYDRSLVALIRWQINGSVPADAPPSISGEWIGDPRERASEFPSGTPGAPALSKRVADQWRDELLRAGRLLPVGIVSADPKASDPGEYELYLVESVVDCVDLRRSSKPKKTTGEFKQAVFLPAAVPSDLPAFRLPQFPGGVHWNGWAVDRLTELLGDRASDVEARLVWSEDPALTPHPNPWGF